MPVIPPLLPFFYFALLTEHVEPAVADLALPAVPVREWVRGDRALPYYPLSIPVPVTAG